MIEFLVKAVPRQEVFNIPGVYRKESWPVLPRKGELFLVDKRLAPYGDIVRSVRHLGRDERGQPIIVIEVPINRQEFDKLRSSLAWSDTAANAML